MNLRSPVLLMGLFSCLFGCGSDSPYNQKNGEWFFKKDPLSLQKGETLTPVNRKFAKSNRTAYFESAMIDDSIDVATFEALSDHYAKDKNHVWYCDSYRDGKEYFTIKHYRTPRFSSADAPSFRMLDAYYARDKSFVYSPSGESFSVRDINTYERVGDQHARDKVSGYYMKAEIPGSDGSTFSAIDTHYSKDAKHVFWSNYDSGAGAHPPVEVSFTLAGADVATFTLLERGYAKDTAQVYYEQKVISKAPAAFRVLDRDYAVSDRVVFMNGQPLKGADAATFEVLPVTTEGATAQDKLGKFNYEKRIKQ